VQHSFTRALVLHMMLTTPPIEVPRPRSPPAPVCQRLPASPVSGSAQRGRALSSLVHPQAARRAEQCDAEATLLQLGAVDPEADVMPVMPDGRECPGLCTRA
jgi:hypothetical protein